MDYDRLNPKIILTITFFIFVTISCSFGLGDNTDQPELPTLAPINSQPTYTEKPIDITPTTLPEVSTPKITVPSPTPNPIIEEAKSSDQISRIAFTSSPSSDDENMYLYVMDEDGSGLENVADIFGKSIDFRWSPDGRKIAVSQTTDEAHEVFVLDLETRQKTLLFSERSGFTTPLWSPDGTKILFSNDQRTIKIANADGSDIWGLADRDQPIYGRDPNWYIDSETIVFMNFNNKLAKIKIDGTGLVEFDADLVGFLKGYPSWSSSKEYFVTIGVEDTTGSIIFDTDIFKYFLDGSQPINLTRDQEYQDAFFSYPLLSSSEEQIYFLRTEIIEDETVSSSIWVMNTDGTNKRLIANFEGNNGIDLGHNYLSLDDQKIAFEPTIEGEKIGRWLRHDIFTVNIDGTGLMYLTQDLEMIAIFDLAWSP